MSFSTHKNENLFLRGILLITFVRFFPSHSQAEAFEVVIIAGAGLCICICLSYQLVHTYISAQVDHDLHYVSVNDGLQLICIFELFRSAAAYLLGIYSKVKSHYALSHFG